MAMADTVSALSSAPVYEFSHQCGHIMAAIYSSKNDSLLNAQFGAFHLSGGTTELLLSRFNGKDFDTEIVGATKDISAGQLVDRIGVMLGLGFPAGKELEKLALQSENKPKIPKIKLDGCYINLSGVENLAKKLYEDTNDASLVAAYVFEYLGEAILGISKSFLDKYGDMPILYVGGVMSNTIIKNKLKNGVNAYFAEPEFSSDNASGIALLARNAFLCK
jgi:N6-L-threonylcarbamoyladenine synthase